MRYGLGLIGLFIVGFCGAVGYGVLGNKDVGIQRTEKTPIQLAAALSPTPAVETMTILAVGDVMLGRSVQEQMERKHDWTWPFASTAGVLQRADLTVGNLEAATVTGCYQKENRYVLCARPEAMAGLKGAGFDALSLANNHTLNWGTTGYAEAVARLDEAGMVSMETGKLKSLRVKGLKVGLMAFDDVSRRLDEDAVMAQVASAAAQVDVLMGMIHWGVEYTHEPTDRQKGLGHLMVDSGMRVVIGAHPHWTQPVERYRDGLIFYSLGNFVFDQMWSEETRSGQIASLKIKFQSANVKEMEYELIPVRIYEYGQPRVVQSAYHE